MVHHCVGHFNRCFNKIIAIAAKVEWFSQLNKYVSYRVAALLKYIIFIKFISPCIPYSLNIINIMQFIINLFQNFKQNV